MSSEKFNILLEAYKLEEEIRAKSIKLRNLKKKIVNMAEFDYGKRTATVCEDNIFAKIFLREFIKWDQNILEKIRNKIGDSAFFKLFIWEYKPVRRNFSSLACYFNDDLKADLKSAKQVYSRSPSIEIRLIGDCSSNEEEEV